MKHEIFNICVSPHSNDAMVSVSFLLGDGKVQLIIISFSDRFILIDNVKQKRCRAIFLISISS